MLALAGAMSTAEIGISLAKMIRAGKVHAISCTAANLEEDIYNLLANRQYRRVPDYRQLSPAEELHLRDRGWNRVTDTCIPEAVMLQLEEQLLPLWVEAADRGEARFPFEYIYRLLDEERLRPGESGALERSWVAAAHQAGIPVYTPGFEDSTLGNALAAAVMEGKVPTHRVVRSGTEQMEHLADWYQKNSSDPIGFFQIGGGIAGDFAICVVPMLIQDLKTKAPLWAYFAQISDSTTSYGSYSGAVPNEKITWFKIGAECPRFMINSDATIVAPLIFAYVLGL